MEPIRHVDEVTDLTHDYVNAYNNIIMMFGWKGVQSIPALVQSSPIPYYETKYPPTKFTDVVTPRNKEGIRRLDEIADYVNSTWIDPTKFTADDVRATFDEVSTLIKGRPHRW